MGHSGVNKDSSSISDISFLIYAGREHIWIYIISCLAIVLGGLCVGIAPYFIGQLVDSYVNDGQIRWEDYGGNTFLLLTYFGLQIFATALTSGSDYIIASRSEAISHGLRSETYQTVFHNEQSHEWSMSQENGHVVSLFSRDIEALWDLYGFAITELLAAIVVIITMCLVASAINIYLGLCLMVYSIGFVCIFYLNGRKIRSYFANVAPAVDKMTDFITSTLEGYETIASFRAQRWSNWKVRGFSEEVVSWANRAHRRFTYFSFATTFVNIVMGMALWLLCLPGIFIPTEPVIYISIGGLVSMQFYLAMVTKPLETISSSAKVFTKSMVSVRRLEEFTRAGKLSSKSIHSGVEKDRFSSMQKLSDRSPVVRLAGLGYSVSDAAGNMKEVLKSIELDIPLGAVIGIAGESGSGKTTLLRILARMISPTEGSIYLNDQDYRQIVENDFRGKVVYLGQKSTIFPVGLIENVILHIDKGGTLENVRPNIEDALRKASYSRSMGVYGESKNLRSSGLSGGEAQRIGVARVFVKPMSLLVVDEPTSALDSSNAFSLAESIQSLAAPDGDVSVVVASHDEIVLGMCDLVLFMEHGRIRDQGSHAELIERNSIYAGVISNSRSL